MKKKRIRSSSVNFRSDPDPDPTFENRIVDPISILKKGSRTGSFDHGSKDPNALVLTNLHTKFDQKVLNDVARESEHR